jgi:hypothetical protein
MTPVCIMHFAFHPPPPPPPVIYPEVNTARLLHSDLGLLTKVADVTGAGVSSPELPYLLHQQMGC